MARLDHMGLWFFALGPAGFLLGEADFSWDGFILGVHGLISFNATHGIWASFDWKPKGFSGSRIEGCVYT